MSDVTLTLTKEETDAILSVIGTCSAAGFNGISHSIYEVLIQCGDDRHRSESKILLPLKTPEVES